MFGAEHIPWIWLIGGLALCAAEMVAPGVFLLWIGLAALAVGVVQLFITVPFAESLIGFAILAVLFSIGGRRIYGGWEGKTGRDLNRRADSLRGKVVVLTEPIVHGSGRAKVADSIWAVTGPDTPAGTAMRVTGVVNGVVLSVEPAANGRAPVA
jgi:membrane protein implicated in regulation of membrane protease activity